MSRIHEALKKAAQERATQLAAGLESGVAEVAAEIRRSIPGPGETDVARRKAPSRIGVGNLPAPLCFEELVKRCAHPEWKPDPSNRKFGEPATGHAGAERFRTLRSRLYQIASNRTLQRLLVTSSVAGEGKTFVAANLAQSIIRQPERRVLLLDADLRLPQLHVVLGAPDSPGVTDYLLGDADECAVIQQGLHPNLFLIPAGKPVSNQSELLLGDRMKHLLNYVSPLFDWIIIDSPPALPVHDASVLADLADGVVLVIQAGATDVDDAGKAAEEFRSKNLLGVVLNRVGKSDSNGNLYYNYCSEAI